MHNIVRIILSSAFLWTSSCAAAQTASVVTPRNFARLRTYTASNGSLWRDETVFFDGLGRESERVNGSFTPGHDLVRAVEYDSTGVAAVEWLPVPCPSGATDFHDAAEVAAARAAAYSDTRPFAKTRCEHSPLMRPIETYGAGEAWHNKGKAVRTAYLCNKSTGLLRCGCYTATGTFSSPVITRKGDRDTDRLNVTQTTDEDGNTTYDFTDSSGRLLLHRRVNGDDCADTYYVYDDRGLLVAVLPPGAARAMDYKGTWSLDNSEELRQYAYLYRYDYNLRLSGRKLPGCEWETFEYDRLGQRVLSQTGNQRAAHEKTFTINDRFGRKAVVGISTGESKYWEICHVHAYRSTEKNAQLGYSIKWIDLTSPKITEAYFYDDYSAISELGLPGLAYKRTGNFDVRYANPKGKLTLSAEAVMNGGDIEGYLWTSYYYDDHGRVVQTASTLKGKSYDCTAYKYDFCGNLLKKFHQHGRSQTFLTTAESTTYEYDGYGRLLTERHNINNNRTVLLRNNSYDNLGQLVSSSRGNSDSLTTTYGYDIRNHRTYATSRLFYESLFYNTTRNGSTPLFNGRISAADAGVPQTYTGPLVPQPPVLSCNYTYDGFGRLVSAVNYKNGRRTNDKDCWYTYDIMGNVETIRRTGQTDFSKYGVVDDIVLEYDGNRIVKATNSGAGPYFSSAMHYGDHADETEEFDYDADGNLVRHADKGIGRIRYNMLNQPDMMEFCDGSYVRYTYTGTGRKLRVDYCVAPNSTYMPDYRFFPNPDTLRVSRAYYGNHVYDGDSLTMVLFDGGYISFNTNVLNPRYHFYATDHLGSVRVVADANGKPEEQDGYYPYGMLDGSSMNYDYQPYKFCGKELDRMLTTDWLDHGARMYDPVVARWWRMDPLAEKNYDVSPYAMCNGDPINFVDNDGERPTAHEAALMAAYVYLDGDKDDYLKKLSELDWKISSFNTSIQKNYTNINQNGLQSELFERTIKGITEYAYVYAGSNSLTDWIEDLTQLLGIDRQYKVAIKNAKTLSKELGDKELTFVGHSLGGGEAAAASMATGRAAITFNSAALSKATKRKYGLKAGNNVTNYRAIGESVGTDGWFIGGDMVNNAQQKVGLTLPGKTIEVKTGIIPTHSIKKFVNIKLPEP